MPRTNHRCRITRISPRDLPELLRAIRELARFERLEHEVETTVSSLRRALFSPNPFANALVARCDGKIVAYAVYFFTFSTFTGRPGIWLDDLYVRPGFRGHGLGKAFMKALAGIAARKGCGRFEWAVLDWNKKARNFYRKLGAKTMNDWLIVRLDRRALRSVAKKKG